MEEIRAHRAQGQDHAAAQDELPCPDFGEQPDWKDCPDNPAPASQSAQTATQGATQSAAQSAFLTEPELSWDDTVNSSSWLGMASHLESSLLERNTLIEDLKKVLEVATREQSDWRRHFFKLATFAHLSFFCGLWGIVGIPESSVQTTEHNLGVSFF